MSQLKTARISSRRDMNREMNVLSSTIRTDGQGEDPAVKALLSEEFTKMNDYDAMQVALAVQQVIKGQASILENQAALSEHIAKLNERMAKYDDAQRKWEQDKLKFIDEVMEKAEKNRITDQTELARMEGGVRRKLDNLVQEAAIKRARDEETFRLKIAREPKVMVTSAGVLEMRSVEGGATPTLVPEVFTFKRLRFVLPPGEPVEMPRSIAEEYYMQQRRKQEGKERQEALRIGSNFDRDNNQRTIAKKMMDIDKKYGVVSEPMPMAAE